MRTAGLLVTGAIAAAFLGGTILNVVNYLIQFSPDKVSAELPTTVVFVLSGLILGGFSAFCFAQIWRDRSGTRSPRTTR